MPISRAEFKRLVIPVLRVYQEQADAPHFKRSKDIMKAWSLLPQNRYDDVERRTSVYMGISYLLSWVENDTFPDIQSQYTCMLEGLGIAVPK